MIAVSAGMRNDVLRSYPDIDPARVHVVHNGIDTADWSRRQRPDPGNQFNGKMAPALADLVEAGTIRVSTSRSWSRTLPATSRRWRSRVPVQR